MRRLLAALLGLVLLLPATAAASPLPAKREGPATTVTAILDGLARAAATLRVQTIQRQEALAHRGRVHPAPQRVVPRAHWQWPLSGPHEVVKPFDPPEERWLPGHRGVDLAGYTYAPVRAVAEGTVTYSGSIAGIGIVSVTHPDGIRSTYQPVTERIEEGQQVSGGERLGYLGAIGSHCLLRTCLHLGAVRGEDDYLDPLLFLQPWELTLLPHAT